VIPIATFSSSWQAHVVLVRDAGGAWFATSGF
jgi:hypothetical protein